MSKHIKTSRGRPVDPPKHENWKRRQRRKRAKSLREYMAGWADRSPAADHSKGWSPFGSAAQFVQPNLELYSRDDLRDTGSIGLGLSRSSGAETNIEASFIGQNEHGQAFWPRPDEGFCACANDGVEVGRKFTGQAISQKNEESQQAEVSTRLTGPVWFPDGNSQLDRVSA